MPPGLDVVRGALLLPLCGSSGLGGQPGFLLGSPGYPPAAEPQPGEKDVGINTDHRFLAKI